MRQSAVVAVLNSRYEQDRMLMQMLQCLFFNEAQCQCTIVASHIPGQHNDLADDLSRNWANIFLSKRLTPVGYLPSSCFFIAVARPSHQRMDLSGLDEKVQFFCSKGVADSTHRTYQSAVRKFHTFCSLYPLFLSPSLSFVISPHIWHARIYVHKQSRLT